MLYTGMLSLSLSMVPAGWAPQASTGPHTTYFHHTPVFSCCGGLQPASCYFGNFEFWNPRILKKVSQRRLRATWYVPCTQAGCCMCFHTEAVWKQACLWSMALGHRISLGVCWCLLLCMYQEGLSGGLFWGRRPLQGWKSQFVPQRGACSMALKHHGVLEANEPASHAAPRSYLDMLAPALGFSTPCIFLTSFVKFKQQYKWLIFPLTVLLTCFTKAHPLTYVFKAAAKLKCIVLWLLTRLASINFYEVYSGHNIPSTVNNFEDIGPLFNFSVKVSKCFCFSFKKLPYLLL